MNKLYFKGLVLAIAATTGLSSCSKKTDPNPEPEKTTKYVLMTMSQNVLTKPGYATAFDVVPSGNISNINSSSLQGMGMGGWRPFGNSLLKMFNTSGNELGIERLGISENKVVVDKFLKALDNTTNGSGNFVVASAESGFYWDGSSPLKIQRFNPTTLSRTGEIDLTAAVNQRGASEAGILFRSIGQKFLAVKGGKLYANITYATTNGTQKGFWDDFYPNVYIAVIDINTGNYEKTITIEDTGSIAYINDNSMYSFDTNGDLYVVTQGRSALGGKSKIARIKAAETDIDKTWELKMDDIMTGGKFVNVFASNGKIITVIPTAPLTGGPNGNINFSEIWEYYTIDVATKTRTKINGVPRVTNPGAAFGTIKIDDKLLLRVNAPSANLNGYYQLNADFSSASSLFNVTEGGSISGFYKITY
ncbi:MAG: hypothetical protein EOO90_12430 [Pedobacter sp.]|nr:MAG: hypothetical protein EOO90_12430 [Pedobacter sp.]